MSRKEVGFAVTLVCLVIFFLFIVNVNASSPAGPSSINNTGNSTKSALSAAMFNISGGYIATINITARVQNTRWKAFIGWVSGKFALDDAQGSTIYDWRISSVNGQVYATRNSSTIAWGNINCSNITYMEQENVLMNQTNPDDNITKTFSDTTHSAFFVGGVPIVANQCPTLNTYRNNATQDTYFQEMVLNDKINEVYAAKINMNITGYNSQTYDFQMLVPENGATGFNGATAYYLYVELT